MNLIKQLALAGITSGLFSICFADEITNTAVPMKDKGAATFYIDGSIQGYGKTEFMVDTGSGYTTINEHTLEKLKTSGNAVYSRQLRGILADGSEKIVSVYRISAMSLGGKCALKDIEAAIFPGKTRQILGLNALRKAGSFTFSFQPPTLTFSGCQKV